MRTILLALLLAVVVAASALAQAGPEKTEPKKKKKKSKADTTRVANSAPDTTRTGEAARDSSRKTAPDTTREKSVPPLKATAPTPPPPPTPTPPAATKPEVDVPGRAEPARPGFSKFVPRAVLCANIENREPVEPLDSVVTGVDTLWFFTEVADLQGTTISHRWKHDGEVRAEIPMSIGGPHWRVYSRKVMLPAWSGRWTVEVVDAQTRVLARRTFVYTPPAAAP